MIFLILRNWIITFSLIYCSPFTKNQYIMARFIWKGKRSKLRQYWYVVFDIPLCKDTTISCIYSCLVSYIYQTRYTQMIIQSFYQPIISLSKRTSVSSYHCFMITSTKSMTRVPHPNNQSTVTVSFNACGNERTVRP